MLMTCSKELYLKTMVTRSYTADVNETNLHSIVCTFLISKKKKKLKSRLSLPQQTIGIQIRNPYFGP